jgi:hypothetical protein
MYFPSLGFSRFRSLRDCGRHPTVASAFASHEELPAVVITQVHPRADPPRVVRVKLSEFAKRFVNRSNVDFLVVYSPNQIVFHGRYQCSPNVAHELSDKFCCDMSSHDLESQI